MQEGASHTPQPPCNVSPLTCKRLIPLLVLVVGLVVFFVLGLHRYMSFHTLRAHRDVLLTWVHTTGVLAAVTSMAVYAVAVAFSFPGGAVLSIAGGLLFGTVWGTVYIVISATIGATVLFLIAKMALEDPLRARAGRWLHQMAAGFRDNALSYVLVLRPIPLLPFFVVNLVPAFLGVPLSTFVIGTGIGIIPGAFVYATVGAGIGNIFDAGDEFSVKGMLTPHLLMALIGLAVLALVPVLYKRLKARTA